MLPRIINLTFILVSQELEEILEQYPEYPYQVAFSSQELRQKLLSHVLSQVPNHYALVEETEELPKDLTFLYASFEEWMRMESLIRESVVRLLGEKADEINSPIPKKDNSIKEPSLWFS
jgi:hypothetical protein